MSCVILHRRFAYWGHLRQKFPNISAKAAGVDLFFKHQGEFSNELEVFANKHSPPRFLLANEVVENTLNFRCFE